MTARVLVNALALRPGGSGVQTYIRQLLRHLAARGGLDLRALVQHDATAELPEQVRAVAGPAADGLRRSALGLRPRRGIDLVHGLNVSIPLSPGVPKVVTVHDLAQWDMPGAVSRHRARALRLQLAASVRRADAVIAVSAFTASRVAEVLGRQAVAIPLAPAPHFAPPSPEAVEAVVHRYRLPDRFVLHVGTIEPRKDVPALAAACRQAGEPLVLAGAGSAAGLGGATKLGWVPTADLPALYGAARIVAYTSRYEGFGIPPLEAMACGAPVVASDIPPLRESLSGAAELVGAGDVDALAARIRLLVVDGGRRAELQAAGLERAASFTWRRVADDTAAVYRSLGVGG